MEQEQGVAFASGYITWNGTKDYNEILQGLDDMEQRHNELGGERSQMIRELIARADKIEEHETTIAELNEQIEELQKEGPATEAGKLKQAEQDMETRKRTNTRSFEKHERRFQ